jgi:hypothetical protein
MKTVKHEIKLERSVKIILGVLAVGILLHAFPIMEKGLFTDANAIGQGPIHRVALCDGAGYCGLRP